MVPRISYWVSPEVYFVYFISRSQTSIKILRAIVLGLVIQGMQGCSSGTYKLCGSHGGGGGGGGGGGRVETGKFQIIFSWQAPEAVQSKLYCLYVKNHRSTYETRGGVEVGGGGGRRALPPPPKKIAKYQNMLSGILGACMYPYADTGIKDRKFGRAKKKMCTSLGSCGLKISSGITGWKAPPPPGPDTCTGTLLQANEKYYPFRQLIILIGL